MKSSQLLQLLAYSLLTIVPLFIVSCGGDDEGDDMMVAAEDMSSMTLEFTIDGTAFEADFSGSTSTIIAVESEGITAVSAGGDFDGTQTFSFGFSFVGAETGSYTLQGEADSSNNGFGLAILQGTTTGLSYTAESIALNVTKYEVNSGFVQLEATFSGTVIDTSTEQVVNLLNGRIVSQ